ncbi:MAG: hypothetical protein ACOYN6_07820 [Ignavibacteria bacterium]
MKKYLLLSVMFLMAAFIWSCASSYTEISGTWTKPGYTGKQFKNILVVALSNDIIKRNIVETAVVNELTNLKVKCTASENIVDFSKIEKDKDGKVDTTKRDEIIKKLTDAGYDGAIVLSLLDVKEQTNYVPGQTYYQPSYFGGYGGYYRGFYGYSYNTFGVVSTPGYYVETKNVFMETRLFDIKNDDMLWATKSETLNPSSLKDFSRTLAVALANTLIKDNVIK